MRIACPKCDWEPREGDRWRCTPGCDYVWNTFETMGRCPQCGKQWRDTCCLECKQWSPHLDWYHDIPTPTEEVEESVETTV